MKHQRCFTLSGVSRSLCYEEVKHQRCFTLSGVSRSLCYVLLSAYYVLYEELLGKDLLVGHGLAGRYQDIALVIL